MRRNPLRILIVPVLLVGLCSSLIGDPKSIEIDYAFASRCAIALPIPLDVPVTIAVIGSFMEASPSSCQKHSVCQ